MSVKFVVGYTKGMKKKYPCLNLYYNHLLDLQQCILGNKERIYTLIKKESTP